MRTTLCNRRLTTLFRGWSTMNSLRSEIWMKITRRVTQRSNTSRNAKKRKRYSFPYLRRYTRRHYACRTIYSMMDSVMASQKLVSSSITSIWTEFFSTTVVWLATSSRRFSKDLPSSKTSNQSSTSTMSWTHLPYQSFSLFLRKTFLTSSQSSS